MTDPRSRILTLLTAIYGESVGAAAAARLLDRLDAFAQQRSPTPPRSPAERLTEDDVILITYGDQVREPGQPPLRTLGEALDTTFADIVTGVHLLPFFPSTSDDGFSVVDYYTVDPALGSWEDVERLGRRYRLMFDAVVNHVSASSAWFRDFLAGAPGAEARFHIVDPATDLRNVTRPRTTPLLTPFETAGGTRYVWTTFSADQIDLNYANPDVLLEMTDVLLAYVAHGASLIRLDAIGYLWKEPGTSCIHLPNTHRIVQLWRAALDLVAPDVLLITETNVPHADNISYFGDGANEAQVVYQFPLAPLVLHTFARGDATCLSAWAHTLTTPSPTTAFLNFLASHDGIGVVPATGILSQAEIHDLCAQIERHGGRVSFKTNPDGSQSPYELNCTWFDALSDPAGSEPQALKIARFIASQAIMLALQGVPGVYIHSLVGSPNYHAGLAETGRARTLNREKWSRAELEARLADPMRHEGSILRQMATLIRTRRRERAFHPNGPQRVLDLHPAVFSLERQTPEGDGMIICLHNVSANDLRVSVNLPRAAHDLISGATVPAGASDLAMAPYQVAWLKVQGPDR